MVKLSKSVLRRRTSREGLGRLTAYSEYRLSDLVETYGADAKLEIDYTYGYNNECEADISVFREREESDDEYNARIAAEEERQRKRADTLVAKRNAEASAKLSAEEEERNLYERLREKYGD